MLSGAVLHQQRVRAGLHGPGGQVHERHWQLWQLALHHNMQLHRWVGTSSGTFFYFCKKTFFGAVNYRRTVFVFERKYQIVSYMPSLLCTLHLLVYSGHHICQRFRQQTFFPDFCGDELFFHISSSPPPPPPSRFIMVRPLQHKIWGIHIGLSTGMHVRAHYLSAAAARSVKVLVALQRFSRNWRPF